MMSTQKVRKQTLTIINEPGSTNYYYSAQNDRFHRNIIRSYYGSVFVILVVVVPFVVYDALARHVGKKQNVGRRYAVEIAVNILLIVLNGWYIVSRGGSPNAECIKGLFCWIPTVRRRRKNPDGRKSNTEKRAECVKSDCNSLQNCGVCQCCKLHCKGVQRLLHVVLHTNVESPIFFIFTVSAIVFYIALAIVATVEQELARATDIIAIFAVFFQSVFVFWTTLVHNPLKLLRRGHRCHSINSFLLSLLFASAVGALAVDIEREHLDPTVHENWYLRALAPLLVDFRVHAAILAYSVRSEFCQQRFTKGEIEDKGIFRRVDEESMGEGCVRPGCKAVYSKESSVVFWRCITEDDTYACNSKFYCNDCFENLIVKVGFCLICADAVTCEPQDDKKPLLEDKK
ncbi:uncharacterized protein LOC134178714 isoform X2 [Corticium candelabrum]|nr:uncharacterized protein LOC134178714 isoform X2 [Corticium candelabrum]